MLAIASALSVLQYRVARKVGGHNFITLTFNVPNGLVCMSSIG